MELFGTVDLAPLTDIGIKLFVAAILGGLVGYDREKRVKTAGLKTNVLICMGSTLYTAVSLQNLTLLEGANTVVDPNRVIAQIVSGVGFLGAGSIIQSRGSVTGITTAATIWIVAAIGAAIGSGQLLPAILFTILILAVLKLASPIYALMSFSSVPRSYHIEIITVGTATRRIDGILSGFKVKAKSEQVILDKKRQKVLYITEVFANLREMKHLQDSLRKVVQVERVSYYESKVLKDSRSISSRSPFWKGKAPEMEEVKPQSTESEKDEELW